MARLVVVYESTPMTPRLDAEGKAREAAFYPPSANPCPNCQAACCTHRVEVSIPDVVRFSDGLSLAFAHAFELAEGGQKPFELDVGPRIAVLRRSEDGYCRFLGRWGEELRCGVYGLRPATCRLYPFTFVVGNVRLGPRNVRCPVPFGIKPDLEEEMSRAAEQAAKDWALHDEIAAAWKKKRKDRSLAAFLRFALRRVRAARGGSKDIDRAPLLYEEGSRARQFQMMVEHRVLKL